MRAAPVVFALLRLALRLEAGPEYDSNSNHVETPAPGSTDPAPIASALLRTTARGSLVWLGGPNAFHLTLYVGGKLFFAPDAAPQDEVVTRLAGELRTTRGRLSLALAFDYYDAWQWNVCPPALVLDAHGDQEFAADTSCHRDFRLGALRAIATVKDGAPSLTAEARVRGYEWKPDEDLSFLGVGGSVTPALRFHGGPERESEWTLSLSGGFEWRRYSGPQLTSATDLGNDPSAPRRLDTVGSLGAHLGYSGWLLASTGWFVEADRSTSFGGSLLYQAVTLDVALPLPARFTLAGRGQLLFFSGGFLPASLAVEDENRDGVMLDLSRDFGAGFVVHARYWYFHNATGSVGESYLRHVASLWLQWETK